MSNYLIESSLCLLVMLLIYRVFLSKTTLHQVKRVFLLASILVPLLLPLANIEVYYGTEVVSEPQPTPSFVTGLQNIESTEELTPTIPIEQAQETTPQESTTQFIDWGIVLFGLYGLITALFLIRLLFQVYKINRLANRSEQEEHPDYRLVLLDKTASPYSFFRYIFMGKAEYDEPIVKQQLLTHELVHVREWHSLDVLLIEFSKAIFWFNPMYWLLANNIRLNHEFIADAGVIAKTQSRHAYQNTLLNFYQRPRVNSPLVSPSDYSFIKNRFQMMQKTTSKKTAVLRLILLIPVMGGILFSFAMDLKPRPKESISSLERVQAVAVAGQPNGFPIDSVFYLGDLSKLPPIPVLYMTNTYPGIDITSRKGRTVISTADGVVKEVVLDDKHYGKYVLVEHDQEFSTLYASLSEVSVKAGEKIKLGQKLGAVGTSMPVHAVSRFIYRVHYAVRKNGQWTSPYEFLKLPPQPQSQKVGFTAMPFGYGRSLDVVYDERTLPSILPFEAESGSYMAFTGMTSDSSTTINSIHDTKLGTEFFGLPNTKVRATADGLVTQVVTNHKNYGNYVVIQHGETHNTMYAKLDEVSVTKGQSVTRGSTIGKIGKTNDMFGRLHYKVTREGLTLSPTNYFTSRGAQGPRFSRFGKAPDSFDWKFPAGFAIKTISYNKAEVVLTKTSGEVITRKATDLSREQKAALLSLNRQPYPFPAKRPVPEEVYSRWENPDVYKIFIDGKAVKSETMSQHQPSDFEHASWVVVSKAVKKRNGYAFELRLQTKAYYEKLKSNQLDSERKWREETRSKLSAFKDI